MRITTESPGSWQKLFLPVLMLFLTFGAASNLGAEVKVSRARVSNGFAVSLQRHSWNSFQCYVENTDDQPARVKVRIRPTKDEDQTSFFSSEAVVPAHTAMYLRFPIMVELAEEHSADVFVNGKKQPVNIYNDSLIRLLRFNENTTVVLNDSSESFGSFTQTPNLKGKLSGSNMSFRYAPVNWELYSLHQAVFAFKPDFSQYTTHQIQALRSYVANGGLLIFLTPQSVESAYRNGLADLLPVTPLEMRKLSAIPGFKDFVPEFTGLKVPEVAFLASAPKERGVTLAKQDELPLVQVMDFGLGTVKAVLFDFSIDTVGNEKLENESAVLKLMARQDLLPDQKAFSDTLDKLTGFEIPGTSEIDTMILVYLIGVAGILVIGLLLKFSGLAWIAAAAFAILMQLFILGKASGAFKDSDSVLAEINLKPVVPDMTELSYASFFSVGEQSLYVSRPGKRMLFSAIPKSAKISDFVVTSIEEDMRAGQERERGIEKAQVRMTSPIDMRTDTHGVAMIDGLHMAPRTSKQFMALGPASTEKEVPELPEVQLSETGLKLKPYSMPKMLLKQGEPESIWLILPGGFREVKMKDGICSLANGSGVFVDPMVTSILESVLTGWRKPSPCLAIVFPVTKNSLEIRQKANSQGKQILLLPARMSAVTRKIRIEPDLMILSSDTSSSRMLMRGNRIQKHVPLMIGQTIEPLLMLPGQLNGIFHPDKVQIDMDYLLSSANTLSVRFGHNDEAEGKPVNSDKTQFQASGEMLEKAYRQYPASLPLRFTTESRMAGQSLSSEQMITTNVWNIHDIKAVMEGTIDESLTLPVYF